jgi:histone deacetylase 11
LLLALPAIAMEPGSGEPSTCSGSQRQLSVSFGSPPASPAKLSASPRLSASSECGPDRPYLRPITRSPSPQVQLPDCPIEYGVDGDNRCTLLILFRTEYDVCFFRLQQLHPFDTKKWSKIADLLREKVQERTGQPLTLLRPLRPASDQDLLLSHTQDYIRRVTHTRLPLLKAFETPLLGCFPMCVIRRKLLRPFRWQVAGSLLAAHLALSFGYAINLGGGFHHCSSNRAAGFCIFADISLMMHYVWSHIDQRMRILIADLDAHQGNGYAHDAAGLDLEQRRKLMIVDLFNSRNYPSDEQAKTQIDKRVELRPHTKDNVYLEYLRM